MKQNEQRSIVPVERIERVIYFIRGSRVMLDRDLAGLFGVETRTLIQAVKRNLIRFPDDFMFQLTKEELKNWMSQIVISNANSSRSQFVILKRGQNIKYLPYAFTEQGIAMLSSVLHSRQAVIVNIEIMRAFIRLRHVLSAHDKITTELGDLKSFLLKHSHSNDREFKRVWQAIEKLTQPENSKNHRQIGFDLN